MRNELFADEHDFAKYDLLLEIIEKTPHISKLASFVMLGPDKNNLQGSRTDYGPGLRRHRLHAFLQDCIQGRNGRQRKLSELRQFMATYCEYLPYGDDNPSAFSHTNRDAYFANAQDKDFENALVFFDPDTGLETRNESSMKDKPGEYLFWKELETVFKRATQVHPESLFGVYQHFNYQAPESQKRTIFQEKVGGLLSRLRPSAVVAVSSIDTTLFLFGREVSKLGHLAALLSCYAGLQQMRFQMLLRD
jgi:hypothetical protein